jgi:N-acyl-D-aspartate/D-glutamate deacylase
MQDQIELLRQGMKDGAFGMSRSVVRPDIMQKADLCSGLTYTPGMYASNSELAILCRVLADEYPGAYYAPHHRSYGFRAIESYGEMLDLASHTGCPLRMSLFRLSPTSEALDVYCSSDKILIGVSLTTSRSHACDLELPTEFGAGTGTT